MGLPATQTHPTEVMLTVAALHVVTAPILLYADVALWTLQRTQQKKNNQDLVLLTSSVNLLTHGFESLFPTTNTFEGVANDISR